MAKLIASLTILLSFAIATAVGQQTARNHKVTEKEAIGRVMRLPEVKESQAYIRKHSKDKRPLFAMIYGEPSKEQPYWWVAVGEDNGMCFVTHFGFFVDVKTARIWYYDTLEGKTVGLQAWRKRLLREQGVRTKKRPV